MESWAGNIHILPEVLPVPTSPGHLLEVLLPAGDGAQGCLAHWGPWNPWSSASGLRHTRLQNFFKWVSALSLQRLGAGCGVRPVHPGLKELQRCSCWSAESLAVP